MIFSTSKEMYEDLMVGTTSSKEENFRKQMVEFNKYLISDFKPTWIVLNKLHNMADYILE